MTYRRELVGWICVGLLYSIGVYFILSYSVAMQRSFTYGLVKQFEAEGILNTNLTTNALMEREVGRRLLSMHPVRTAHRLVFGLSIVMTILGGIAHVLLVQRLRIAHQNQKEIACTGDGTRTNAPGTVS